MAIKASGPATGLVKTAPTANTGRVATAGNFLQSAGSTISNTTSDMMTAIADLKNMGAQMANAASLQAQENQFAFNSAEAALNRQYNTEMWEKNAAFNSAEAELNRKFQAEQAEIARNYNSAEAKTNRDWQERMANTAYQREVADLKKAGLNPVLAAFNSGAATGSGATASTSGASGSSASSSPASASAASGSNYSGQGANISDSLAVIGAIGGLIGQGVSALGAYIIDKQNQTANLLDQIANTSHRVQEGAAGASRGAAYQLFTGKWGGTHSSGGGSAHTNWQNRR